MIMNALNHLQPDTTIRTEIVGYLGQSIDNAIEKLNISLASLLLVPSRQTAIKAVLVNTLKLERFNTSWFCLILQTSYEKYDSL